jgi:hypothetical protein
MHRSLVLVAEEPECLLDRLCDYRLPVLEKWIDQAEA